jgi:hypothetical protein
MYAVFYGRALNIRNRKSLPKSKFLLKFPRIRFDNNRQRFFAFRFRQRRVGRFLQRVRPLRPLLQRRHHLVPRLDRLRLHLIQNVRLILRNNFFGGVPIHDKFLTPSRLNPFTIRLVY